MSDAATASGIAVSVKPLDPALDAEAAVMLARCPGLGAVERAAEAIRQVRGDERSSLFGVMVDGRLAGAYILAKVQFANEIPCLAIAPEHERRGHGKMCLYDALLRSGKRPLVVEADDSNVAFFKRCGFKMVGKRKGADGAPRYRLGWHAPLPKPDGSPGDTPC